MHETALTPRQARFCAALMTARSIDAAAQAANIARRTAFVYLANPAVKRRLAELGDDAIRHAARRAVAAIDAALDVLEAIAGDEATPAGARVAAARAILENAARLRTEAEIAERISALEAAQAMRAADSGTF